MIDRRLDFDCSYVKFKVQVLEMYLEMSCGDIEKASELAGLTCSAFRTELEKLNVPYGKKRLEGSKLMFFTSGVDGKEDDGHFGLKLVTNGKIRYATGFDTKGLRSVMLSLGFRVISEHEFLYSLNDRDLKMFGYENKEHLLDLDKEEEEYLRTHPEESS